MGFAMARLPRPVWKKILPDLTGDPYYPVMSWLAVDGYGFDRAYFDTKRWVDEQRVPKPYPWAGAPDYFPRAVDQGIGRALWFICGGSACTNPPSPPTRIRAVISKTRQNGISMDAWRKSVTTTAQSPPITQ